MSDDFKTDEEKEEAEADAIGTEELAAAQADEGDEHTPPQEDEDKEEAEDLENSSDEDDESDESAEGDDEETPHEDEDESLTDDESGSGEEEEPDKAGVLEKKLEDKEKSYQHSRLKMQESNEKAAELKRKNAEQEAELAQYRQTEAKRKRTAKRKEINLDPLKKDFPEVAEAIGTVQDRFEVLEEENAELQKKIEQQGSVSDEQVHFATVGASHRDFKTVLKSEDFHNYVSGLSTFQRKGANIVLAEGSADEVVELIGDFKKTRQTGKKNSSPAKLDAARRRAAPGKLRGGGPPRTSSSRRTLSLKTLPEDSRKWTDEQEAMVDKAFKEGRLTD